MKRSSVIDEKDFESLLGFLSTDRNDAGHAYERMREGLIRFFGFRGCNDPETLADEAINRIAAKIATFDSARNVKQSSFFYGFATNVWLEHRRSLKKLVPLEPEQLIEELRAEGRAELSDEAACLRRCLRELEQEDRELVVKYYSRERQEKIELRRRLTEQFNCSQDALYTRIFRIRASLRRCIERCMEDNA